MNITLKGNTSQFTTTGKNIVNISSTYSITGVINIEQIINDIPAGTYKLTCGDVIKGSTNYPSLRINSNYYALTPNANINIVIPDELTSVYFYSNGSSYSDSQGIVSKIDNLMISISGGDYEPYTGGIASPNPDYPQDIEVVTGENTIIISNEDNTESQTFNINLGNLELCKIGEYQDYIYKENNKWYKYSRIDKKQPKLTTSSVENIFMDNTS